jgi:AbiV family abortive infection protein
MTDQTRDDVEACFRNARDLLRAAKRLLEDEKLPNISFHLAVLALEEVGKAVMLGTRDIMRAVDGETVFVDKRLDDHVFKLFWALWTPSLARGNVSREEYESLRGLARSMHEDRLGAMYVAPDREAGEASLQDMDDQRVRQVVELTEARLGMETSRDWQAIDLGSGSIMRWFLDATNDPEKRNLIFGQKAFDQLAELGQMREWMAWLKEQFDQAEVMGRESLQRELARVVPDWDERGEPKWQVAIRLFSYGQSIRNKAIRSWNSRPTWIRMSPVQNDSSAVDVEFTYHEAVSAEALAPMSYRAANMFVAAMNIGSLGGFWWWHRAEQTEKFYQRLTDLKAAPGMKIALNMHAWPKFEWMREALDDSALQRIGLCFGMMARLERPVYQAVIEAYLTGLALIGKSDLHLNFAPQAAERFAACLLEAMRHFGAWDVTDAGIPAAIAGFFGPLFKQPEDEQELIDLLRQLRQRPLNAADVTLEKAAILKFFCDVYLVKRFEMMAGDLAAEAAR